MSGIKIFGLRLIPPLWFVKGLPKTILFNFKYFNFKDAIKLPVFVSSQVLLKELNGTINLDIVRTGVIRLGFNDVGIFDRQRSRTIWQVSGTVEFKGSAIIGHGSKICVGGNLVIGNNFRISAESTIMAFKKITIGNDVLLSWDILIMDTDYHEIYDENHSCINQPKAVVIGNNVWIGCRSLILKGVEIADGVVVAANTTLAKSINSKNSIVGGNPVRVLKDKIVVKW